MSLPQRRLPPSPPADPIIGHFRYILSDVVGLLFNCAEMGGIVLVRAGNKPGYVVTDPELVRYVLQDNVKNYEKHSRAWRRLRHTLGNGLLFNAGGESWRRQRRIAAPAFHRPRIERFAEIMATSTEDLVTEWRAVAARDGTVDVDDAMVKLTMRIVTRAMFTTDISEDINAIRDSISAVIQYNRPRFPYFTAFRERFFGYEKSFEKALAKLHEVVDRIIAQRRQSREEHHDLLAMLMESRDEVTGEAMSDTELRDEALSIFLAGHETTANALTWSWYCLSKNPAVRRALRQEAVEVLGGRSPRLADIARLDLARRVFAETMRLYPPVWMMQRTAMEDDTIGGFHVPKGAMVTVCPYVTHRLREYWPNPEGYDPDRFLPDAEALRPKYAYFPFSAGPRVCIGNAFALIEGQIALAMLSQHFDLDLPPNVNVAPEFLITLRPKGGMKMRIQLQREGGVS
jgi:cytochrome P450